MAVSLPRCRHKKSPELSRMAPHPRGAGTERHVYRHDPRGDRNGTISTSNAIRAFYFIPQIFDVQKSGFMLKTQPLDAKGLFSCRNDVQKWSVFFDPL